MNELTIMREDIISGLDMLFSKNRSKCSVPENIPFVKKGEG